MKSVAIIQSNYIPWKGYFDIINCVDEFILYDEVQYTRNDWRNRNRIISSDKLLWLTIPVAAKNHYEKAISSVTVADSKWNSRHLKTIHQSYARARHFDTVFPLLEQAYALCRDCEFLSQINLIFISEICKILGITTKIKFSSDYQLSPGLSKTERLVALCTSAGANLYLSGPSAKAYLDERKFQDAGIAVEYMNYEGYPVYRQLSRKFEHQTSVIDLLLNEGPAAHLFMKSFS